MIALLEETFQQNPCFVFHRTRHVASLIYNNAIRSQKSYLSNTRVVLIVGITRKLMFYLSIELLNVQGVVQVLEHSEADSDRRYSVMTTIQEFFQVSKLISANLATSAKHLNHHYNLLHNPELPEVEWDNGPTNICHAKIKDVWW